MAKTLTPIGGVTTPSSTMMTTITPNQMGSKPAFIAIGKNSGTVRTRAGKAFMNMPITT